MGKIYPEKLTKLDYFSTAILLNEKQIIITGSFLVCNPDKTEELAKNKCSDSLTDIAFITVVKTRRHYLSTMSKTHLVLTQKIWLHLGTM